MFSLQIRTQTLDTLTKLCILSPELTHFIFKPIIVVCQQFELGSLLFWQDLRFGTSQGSIERWARTLFLWGLLGFLMLELLWFWLLGLFLVWWVINELLEFKWLSDLLFGMLSGVSYGFLIPMLFLSILVLSANLFWLWFENFLSVISLLFPLIQIILRISWFVEFLL